MDISDETVVKAARGGVEDFEMLYKGTGDYVYNIAYRITNNREDAQEVAQDVFVKVYDHLKYFNFRSSFKTWLYRIAVNAAINLTKRRARELLRRADYNDRLRVEAAGEAQKDNIEKESTDALIRSLLKKLNPDQRACVVLRDIEGLSYKEISEALKVNINTVRSRLKRAREALAGVRQKMEVI